MMASQYLKTVFFPCPLKFLFPTKSSEALGLLSAILQSIAVDEENKMEQIDLLSAIFQSIAVDEENRKEQSC